MANMQLGVAMAAHATSPRRATTTITCTWVARHLNYEYVSLRVGKTCGMKGEQEGRSLIRLRRTDA